MPWVHFTAAFDWKPTPQTTIAYLAGHTKLVTTRCANAAIARGVAEKMKTPRKDDGDLRKSDRAAKTAKETGRDASNRQESDPDGA